MSPTFSFIFQLLIFGVAHGAENLTRSDFGTKGISGVVIGDRLYFTDGTEALYTWEEAREYCRLEGGELAKVTNRTLYNYLRLSLSRRSTYWIDGIDSESYFQFDIDTQCTSEGYLDWYDMNPENLDLTPKQCLALVKGGNARTSKIQAIDCIIPHRVLCAQPLNGCQERAQEIEFGGGVGGDDETWNANSGSVGVGR